ncbi:GT2 family glycosyltransferase [Neobacillus sp. B4I6]|uniref:glycosyltransferase family 2 protein n=1 Tax=Neobacillus sp. B4I6 TaxID=3373925 RepID=UPI003D1E0BE1
MSKVTVCIVTWNSAKYLRNCLNSITKQSYKDFELLIIDNNSEDTTLEIIKELTPFARIVKNKKNLGFCGGHNLGISLSKGDYYMPFNPDIVAEPDFLKNMVIAIELADRKCGSVSGKLLRYDPLKNKKTNIIDSTGVYFKKNRRSLDRGSEEIDNGQFNNPEYVFGASGAAPLYNKEMLEDIKIDNQYFMEYFFAYREDVDLAWRAQHRGWNCIYYPNAIAYHVRNNTPLKREQMSNLVNMHSVKNRILLLLQNETKYGFLIDGWYFLIYDLLIFLYTLFKERTSVKGFIYVLKNLKSILRIRKHIIQSSVIDGKDIIKWFGRIESVNLK